MGCISTEYVSIVNFSFEHFFGNPCLHIMHYVLTLYTIYLPKQNYYATTEVLHSKQWTKSLTECAKFILGWRWRQLPCTAVQTSMATLFPPLYFLFMKEVINKKKKYCTYSCCKV